MAWRNLNEMEKIYGGGDDPEDAKRGVMIYGGELNEVEVVGHRGQSGGWAAATLALISSDIAVPEPTDGAWPKWVGYAVLGGVAYLSTGNFHTTKEDPTKWKEAPYFNNENLPNDPPKWGKPILFGVGAAWAAYEYYDHLQNNFSPPIKDNTRIYRYPVIKQGYKR